MKSLQLIVRERRAECSYQEYTVLLVAIDGCVSGAVRCNQYCHDELVRWLWVHNLSVFTIEYEVAGGTLNISAFPV